MTKIRESNSQQARTERAVKAIDALRPTAGDLWPAAEALARQIEALAESLPVAADSCLRRLADIAKRIAPEVERRLDENRRECERRAAEHVAVMPRLPAPGRYDPIGDSGEVFYKS